MALYYCQEPIVKALFLNVVVDGQQVRIKIWLIIFENDGNNVVVPNNKLCMVCTIQRKQLSKCAILPHIINDWGGRVPMNSRIPIHSQRQLGLDKGMQIFKKCELDTKWSQTFYKIKITISIARHPTFIEVVKGS